MPRVLPAARTALCALFAICCLSQAARGQNDPPFQPGTAPEHYFILLFDSPIGGLRQIDDLSTAIEGWIGRKLSPGDAVAVASYYGCELQVQQDFTRDHAALSEAIADAVRGRVHTGQPAEARASLLAHLPPGEELTRRTASFYGLLQVLAEASDAVPGRKSLMVFSKGFGRSHLSEAEGGMALHAALTGDGLLGSPIQEKYLSDRRLYEPTLRALQAARISLYPVDLATDYRETYPLAGVMCQLAAGTGGRYFYPVTDVPSLLDRITEDEKAEPAVERIAGNEGGRTVESPGQGRE